MNLFHYLRRIWPTGDDSARPRRRSENMPLFIGGVLTCVVLLVFGFNTWTTRNRELFREEAVIANYAGILAEHAERALDSIDLALEGVHEVYRDVASGEITPSEAV